MRATPSPLHAGDADPSQGGRWELPVVLVVFALLRVVAAVHAPLSFPDTPSYTKLNFLGEAPRFWTVPLLWNVFPTNWLREAAQISIGIGAWSTLAWSVDRSLRRTTWLRRGAVATVLMLGLVPQVTGWDGTLMSESVSTSLLVLLVGLMLRLTRSRSRWVLGTVLLVGTLWVFARHVNLLMYLVLSPFLLVFCVRSLPHRSASLFAVALLGIALWGAYSITRPGPGTVWKRNALYIVMDRVAHDPGALKFFEAHGLPAAKLRAQSAVSFDSAADHLLHDGRFMGWIAHHFRNTYGAYLVRHLPRTVETAFARVPTYISLPLPLGKARSVLPRAIANVVWGTSPRLILLWVAAAALLILFAMVVGAEVAGLPVVAVLLLTAAIGTVVIWCTTDPVMTLARQFMPVAVTLRLGVVLGIAFTLNVLPAALAERRSRRTARAATAQS